MFWGVVTGVVLKLTAVRIGDDGLVGKCGWVPSIWEVAVGSKIDAGNDAIGWEGSEIVKALHIVEVARNEIARELA